MSKRLNKLIDEMNLNLKNAGYKIKAQDIKNRVNDTLNADLQERKNFMRQRFFKTAAITATIIVLTTVTAFAAQNIDLLKTFFVGDTSSMQGFVKTPEQSVTDGRFTLTLEQVLASKYQFFVIYSVEGLTDDAVQELMSDKFTNIDTISFAPENWNDSTYMSGYSTRELLEKRTAAKRYWAIESSAVLNTDEADFFIRLNKMKNPQKIIVPMKCKVETKEFSLAGQPYGDAVIKYSPLGIIFEKGIKNNSKLNDTDTGVFFRMKDGEIKTFNELLDLTCYGGLVKSEEGTEYQRYEYSGLFREIQKISDYKSIIIGNIEYDIKDTSKTKPVQIDEHLYPFNIKPVYKDVLWLPVYEFSKKINADFKWDDKSRSATIKYRGSKYVITDGSDVVLKDGKEMKLEGDSKAFILDGKLVAPESILYGVFYMTNYVKPFDENGDKIDVKDWIWTITP